MLLCDWLGSHRTEADEPYLCFNSAVPNKVLQHLRDDRYWAFCEKHREEAESCQRDMPNFYVIAPLKKGCKRAQ